MARPFFRFFRTNPLYALASLASCLALSCATGCRISGEAANAGLDAWINGGQLPLTVSQPTVGSTLATAALGAIHLNGACPTTQGKTFSVSISGDFAQEGIECESGLWESQAFDFSSAPDGTIRVAVRVVDSAGQLARSISATWQKDTVAPLITLSAPSSDILHVGDTSSVTVTYSEDATIALTGASVTKTATGDATCTVSVIGTGKRARTLRIGACTGNGTLALGVLAGSASDAAGNVAAAAGPSPTLQVTTPLLPEDPEQWDELLAAGATAAQKSGIIARAAEANAATLLYLATDATLSSAQAAALAAALDAIALSQTTGLIAPAEATSDLALLATHGAIGSATIAYRTFSSAQLRALQASAAFGASAQVAHYDDDLAYLASAGARATAAAVLPADLTAWLGDATFTDARNQALAFLCHGLAVARVIGATAGAADGRDCVFALAQDPLRNSQVAFDYSSLDFSSLADSALYALHWVDAIARDLSLANRDFLAGCPGLPCSVDFTRAALTRSDLAGARLIGGIFASADLTSVSLTGADVRAADFRLATVTGATLVSATSLMGAHLDGADLHGRSLASRFTHAQATSLETLGYGSGTYFTGSNLTGSSLAGAYLPQADFSGATLAGTDLSATVLDSASGLTGEQLRAVADVRGASLQSVLIPGADLSGVNLSGTDLRGADLSGATLASTGLATANLISANLSGVDLTTTILTGAIFGDRASALAGTVLAGANLTGLDLSGRDLAGVVLSGASLAGINLSGTYLGGSTLSNDVGPVDFSGADLRGATFDGATVSETSFGRRAIVLAGADLTQASLRSLDLTGAVLAGATVDTTDFTGSTAPAVDWTGAIGSLAGALSHLTSSVGANFTACDLTGANLSGRDLHTFTLDTTRLSGVNLSGATLPSSLLLGYLASDGSEVRFSYDTNKSATTNKADFLAALATVDSTQPAVVIEAAAIWVDGSALSP